VVHRVLILVALAGCYHPELQDCADHCEASGLCPDGLSCVGGYCRVAGATGQCAGEMIDAPTGGSCPPMAPQGQDGCLMVDPAVPVAPECYVICGGTVTGTTALAYHFMSWLPASIVSSQQESDAEGLLASGEMVWLGLHAPAGQGTSLSAWMWADGKAMTYMHWAASQPVDNATENCAVLTSMGWISDSCSGSHPFLIDSPPP
jgi:hypothetical protein